jgi:hypothetical protein
MKHLKLFLFLSGPFITNGAYASAAEESKEESQVASLNKLEEAIPAAIITIGEEKILFSSELLALSPVLQAMSNWQEKAAFKSDAKSKELSLLGISLQETHNLLSAFKAKQLPEHLAQCGMKNLFQLLSLADYLLAKDLTDALADYIVKRTMYTSLKKDSILVAHNLMKKTIRSVSLVSEILFPKLNPVLEELLMQKFRINRFELARVGDVLQGHTGCVTSVAFNPDGKKIVSGSWDTTVRLWQASTGSLLTILSNHASGIMSVAFNNDGTRIAFSLWNGDIFICDTLTGDRIKRLPGDTSSIASIAFSHDGSRIASGSWDNTVCIWDIATGMLLHRLNGHTGIVRSVSFSNDSRLIVSGAEDATIRIWDTVEKRLLSTLKGHTEVVSSVACSPDGLRIASGSWDNTVCIWNIATGMLLHRLNGHKKSVLGVAFSPDGQCLVSGSFDKTICIWDVATGGMINTLNGHTGGVRSVAFSPSGTQIISGSNDKTVRIWEMPSAEDLFSKMYLLAQNEERIAGGGKEHINQSRID